MCMAPIAKCQRVLVLSLWLVVAAAAVTDAGCAVL